MSRHLLCDRDEDPRHLQTLDGCQVRSPSMERWQAYRDGLDDEDEAAQWLRDHGAKSI